MYYKERFDAGEMSLVTQSMRDSFSVFCLVEQNPHAVLIKWGESIRYKFDHDNLHLLGQLDRPGLEQMVSCIKQQGQTIGNLHAALITATSSLLRPRGGDGAAACAGICRAVIRAGAPLFPPSSPPSNAATPAATISPPCCCCARLIRLSLGQPPA